MVPPYIRGRRWHHSFGTMRWQNSRPAGARLPRKAIVCFFKLLAYSLKRSGQKVMMAYTDEDLDLLGMLLQALPQD